MRIVTVFFFFRNILFKKSHGPLLFRKHFLLFRENSCRYMRIKSDCIQENIHIFEGKSLIEDNNVQFYSGKSLPFSERKQIMF